MILSHRIRLYPNNKQVTHCRRACGTRRFAYNWALAESRRLHEEGTKTSGFGLVKRFNAIKAEQFPWAAEVSKWAPQKAIQDAWGAFKRWWARKAKAPRFKKKGRCRESFYIGRGHFRVDGKRLRVPKIGWVRMAQEVRFPGTIKSVTISQDGDRWFAALQVEIDESCWSYPHACKTQAVCGVDLGVRDLVVLDNGVKFQAPRGLKRKERKLRRLHKSVCRKRKGSRGQREAIRVLREAHRKIRDARRDVLHRISAEIVQSFRWIGIEDLHVKGMLKNHRLARAISDASFGELRNQITYKAFLAGSHLFVADRFFPSSKTCSICGYQISKLPLRIRQWDCPSCGGCHDRDVNAAINLREVARRHRDTLTAGGGVIRLPTPCESEAAFTKPETGCHL